MLLICLHLLSAVVFVGYVIVDFIFIAGRFDSQIKRAIKRSSALIYAVSFVLLITTGLIMAWQTWALSSDGFKVILSIKVVLIALMLLLTAFSIFLLRVRKLSEHFLINQAHLIALFFCVLIVICAKLLSLV